ncbi:nuclear transport factor 2 family protein [Emcibacter sp. SYSU 3D8]|uniref:nuclear transport factor 2 family protein n=1 Tax=Emcibacter sp. SYSU 3D8 TaxID=3133969 RepID=UPI0031FE860A
MNAARSHVDLIKFIFSRRLLGDYEPLLNAVSDDVEWCSIGESGALPWSGKWHGKAGVVAFFDAVANAVDVVGFEAIDHIVDDEQIALLGRISFRSKGSTRIREEQKVDIFTFRDGKIVKFWEVFQVQPVIASLQPGA